MKEHNNKEIDSFDTKPVLVFVHGYLGGSRQWCSQKEYFSRYIHVLTQGLPGFGDNYLSTSPDSIHGFTNYVLKQIDKSKINRFHLIGHSMGA